MTRRWPRCASCRAPTAPRAPRLVARTGFDGDRPATDARLCETCWELLFRTDDKRVLVHRTVTVATAEPVAKVAREIVAERREREQFAEKLAELDARWAAIHAPQSC